MKKSMLLLLSLCFMISNAQKFKKIKGNEKITTITRTTADYDKITISGSFDIKLLSGKEGTITIKGDENLLGFIKTEVNNGNLSVYFEKRINIQYDYNSAITITIPFEKINELSFSGSGNLNNTDALVSENFKFTMSGSGNVSFMSQTTNLKVTKSGSGNLNITGSTSNLETNTSGSGNANLFDLTSENVVASLSGSGNLRVNCTGNLNANSSGSGTIKYKGTPANVTKKASGSGSITSY